jgi:hypothetical protein
MKMGLVYVSELRMGQFWLAPKWIVVSKKCSLQLVGDPAILFQPTKQDGAIGWLYYNPYNQQCPEFLGVNLNGNEPFYPHHGPVHHNEAW